MFTAFSQSDTHLLTFSGMNDGIPPPFLSVFPPVMDPMCSLPPGHPLGQGAFMYFVVNPNEPFIPFRPNNEVKMLV